MAEFGMAFSAYSFWKNLTVEDKLQWLYFNSLEERSDQKQHCIIGAAFTLHFFCSFYLAVRKEAETKLVDGTGHRPHYSLRTLCRALRFAASNPCSSIQRSLYEVITCIEVYFSLCIHCRVCLGKGKSTLLGAVLKTNDSLILMCSVCFFS